MEAIQLKPFKIQVNPYMDFKIIYNRIADFNVKEFNPFVEWNTFHLDFSYDTNSVTHFKQIAQIFQK
jgi:hypothetical protein